MRHYKSIPDACYGAVLLAAAVLALLTSLASLDLLYVHRGFYISYVPPLHYPLAGLLVATLVARWQLQRRGIRWWTYCCLLLLTLYVMLFCASWFRSGLHDVVLYFFGSHGRFGCHDERYDSYIFRDDTTPWILCGPLVLATIGHWFSQRPPALMRLIRWSTTYESRKLAS